MVHDGRRWKLRTCRGRKYAETRGRLQNSLTVDEVPRFMAKAREL